MHELSICLAMIKQVNEIMQARPEGVLKAIHVEIGALSGVETDLLQRAFDSARSDTAANQSRLVIHLKPVRVYCPACDYESSVSINNLACKRCHRTDTRLIGGNELLLRELEISQKDSRHV